MSFEHLLTFGQAGLAIVFLSVGIFFVLAGAIGVIRLPDFYTRLHAAGMTDTLGAEMILLGLIMQAGFSQTSLKLALIGFILFLTSPSATHAIVNAAYHAGLKPIIGKYKAPLPGENPKEKTRKNIRKTNKTKGETKHKGGRKNA